MKVRRILHPTDFSQSADTALQVATTVARLFDAALLVGHVSTGPESDESRITELENRLRKAVVDSLGTTSSDGANLLEPSLHIISHERPALGIAEFARKQDIDLIVIGTHGSRPVRRFLLGSVAFGVLHEAQCDVLIVPDTYQEGRTGAMLVPLDLRDRSPHMVDTAAALADRLEMPMDLLHVIDLPEKSQLHHTLDSVRPDSLSEVALNRLNDFAGRPDPDVPVSVHVDTGHPAGTILRYVEEHDIRLLALASSGMSADERIRYYPMESEMYDDLRWMVSRVTERLATYSRVPVWVVKRFPEQEMRGSVKQVVHDPSVLDI